MSGWPHKEAKCYGILWYTDCLLYTLNKVINTWPASRIKRIKSVLLLNILNKSPHGKFRLEIFKRIFSNEKDLIPIKISLKFVPKGAIDNTFKVGNVSSNVLASNRALGGHALDNNLFVE